MNNPELASHLSRKQTIYTVNMTPRTMFDYDTHRNIPWNFREYSPEKSYLDPKEQVLQRKYSTQRRGDKSALYTTRRGFYMDYDLKVAKSVPGSSKSQSNYRCVSNER
jgi:hypothetical protein